PTGKVQPVRPAAGMPPSNPSISSPATTQPPVPVVQNVPSDLKETGPSLPTAPRPAPLAPQVGVAPRGRPVHAPRPAAGAPPSVSAPPPSEEPHPADGDGPTIQALTEMNEESFTAARPPMLSEPPTMMGQNQ